MAGSYSLFIDHVFDRPDRMNTFSLLFTEYNIQGNGIVLDELKKETDTAYNDLINEIKERDNKRYSYADPEMLEE